LVAKSYEEALKWYRKAAEQGDLDSQCALGSMYLMGKETPPDSIQALSLIIVQVNRQFHTGEYTMTSLATPDW
jgi:TPR repeat protein